MYVLACVCVRVCGCFPPILVYICSSSVFCVLLLVWDSEKRNSLHWFISLLLWHSALAWQPFMPKKYLGSAQSPSSHAAGSRAAPKYHVPLREPVCPIRKFQQASIGTEHLLFLFSSCLGRYMTQGDTHFRGGTKSCTSSA